ALVLLDLAMYRPGRKALRRHRLWKIERLLYALFFASVLLEAFSSYGMILAGGRMRGSMLIMHMSVAGLFAVTLTVLGVLWAEQSAFNRSDEPRFHTGEKVVFWLTILSGLATMLSALLGMMSWFGSDGQVQLLRLHRYGGL